MACPALTFLIHCIQSICLYNTAKSRSAAPQTESIHSAEMIPQPFQHKRNIITFTKGGLLFTITGDLFPGVWRVHEGSVVDLVVDILVLIERECPTQADVHNDTDRPHVQWAVVTLVQQNLRGQVGWGADYRAAERLLANDAGKTEVTQLHLREGNIEER